MPTETSIQWRSGWRDHCAVLEQILTMAKNQASDPAEQAAIQRAIDAVHATREPPRHAR